MSNSERPRTNARNTHLQNVSFAEDIQISEATDADARAEITEAEDGYDPNGVRLRDAELLRVLWQDVEYIRKATGGHRQRHDVEIQQWIPQ